MSIELGPEILSVTNVYDPVTKETFKHPMQEAPGWQNLPNRPNIRLDPHMTEEAITEATMENARRRRADRILAQLQIQFSARITSNSTELAVQAYTAKLNGKLPPVKPAYIEPPVKCPEFGDIDKYLFRNRLQLALDTTSWMPENTMYHYIRRNGGLDIDVSTWRAFLLRCNQMEYLFW